MGRKIAIALIFVACTASVQAQVRKCVGPNGKVTYSDSLCAGGTASETSVRTDANTLDSSGYRQQAEQMRSNAAVDQAMSQEASSCKFEYMALGDSKGKALASAAKQECLANIRAKATGQPISKDAYNTWKDHHTLKSAQRQSAVDRANANDNANATRQAIERNTATNQRPLTCRSNHLKTELNCN